MQNLAVVAPVSMTGLGQRARGLRDTCYALRACADKYRRRKEAPKLSPRLYPAGGLGGWCGNVVSLYRLFPPFLPSLSSSLHRPLRCSLIQKVASTIHRTELCKDVQCSADCRSLLPWLMVSCKSPSAWPPAPARPPFLRSGAGTAGGRRVFFAAGT